MRQPHPEAIALAERTAALSRCHSQRGAVLYAEYDDGESRPIVYGTGYNGPPYGVACLGDCGEKCGQQAVHAEMRALRGCAMGFGRPATELVHVKLGPDGKVMAGKRPCCVQCSREIVDSRIVGYVWLYEASDAAALAEWEAWATTSINTDQIPKPTSGTWVRYSAEEFHLSTLINLGLA